jgi:hypothetical protein
MSDNLQWLLDFNQPTSLVETEAVGNDQHDLSWFAEFETLAQPSIVKSSLESAEGSDPADESNSSLEAGADESTDEDDEAIRGVDNASDSEPSGSSNSVLIEDVSDTESVSFSGSDEEEDNDEVDSEEEDSEDDVDRDGR